MASFQDIDGVLEMEVLVAFTDLTQFARYVRGRTNREIFETMSHYYELVGDIVSEGGGTVVKFMGDAILLGVSQRWRRRGRAGARAFDLNRGGRQLARVQRHPMSPRHEGPFRRGRMWPHGHS